MGQSLGTVLVVDDDAEVRRMLKEILQFAGYKVSMAANGQEAMIHLRAQVPPGLILLDLCMPVMDGWQFRMAQMEDPALRRIPVVVLTGEADLPLGVQRCLRKPIDVTALLLAVERDYAHF